MTTGFVVCFIGSRCWSVLMIGLGLGRADEALPFL